MNKLILLGIILCATGCTTIKQAQTDFQNLQKTIQYHSDKPVVRNVYF